MQNKNIVFFIGGFLFLVYVVTPLSFSMYYGNIPFSKTDGYINEKMIRDLQYSYTSGIIKSSTSDKNNSKGNQTLQGIWSEFEREITRDNMTFSHILRDEIVLTFFVFFGVVIDRVLIRKIR